MQRLKDLEAQKFSDTTAYVVVSNVECNNNIISLHDPTFEWIGKPSFLDSKKKTRNPTIQNKRYTETVDQISQLVRNENIISYENEAYDMRDSSQFSKGKQTFFFL